MPLFPSSRSIPPLETAVDVANKLFLSARAEYIEVLLAQRDLFEVRTVLVEAKLLELSAIVNTYRALGGGVWLSSATLDPAGLDCPPFELQPGENPSLPLPPSPDEKPQSEETLQDMMSDPAPAADKRADTATVAPPDGGLDADALHTDAIVPQPPMRRPKDGDLQEFENAPGLRWEPWPFSD